MFRLIKRMGQHERLMMAASLVFIVAQVWLDLKMPDYMSTITTLVETAGSEMKEILLNGGYMLLCALGSVAASILTGYFAARIAAGFSMNLREAVFKKVMCFNNEETSHFSIASLITRTTNDITQVQMFIAMGFQSIVKAPILVVWGIIKISGKQWQWSTATLGAVLVILMTMMTVIVFAVPKFRIIQTLTDNLNRVIRENLNGIRVVRAYNAENYQKRKFEKANKELTDTNLFVYRVTAIVWPMLTFVELGVMLVIYWIGAYLIEMADRSYRLVIFSDMVVFSAYAMQIIMAFMMVAFMFIMVPRVLVSARRINEVFDTGIRMKNGERKDRKPGESGRIELKEVCFRYPGAKEDVLHNISFTVKSGETVAIIGETASGKTSLINLIPRFYDVSSGEVFVDGINVKEYDTSTLRDKIGFISQRAVLFSGTVESNVAYGQEVSDDEQVLRALDTAQAYDFVSQMNGDLKASIAQDGSNVSGGQKQRISIARAVYKQPEIYIFDDSFSALDYRTDRILRQKLDENTKNSTKIIVAQRIGTIRNANRIVVLKEGSVAGIGTHEELMKECTVYQEIAFSQLSEEELHYA